MHARDWMIELRTHLHNAGWTVSNTAELFEIVRKEIEWDLVHEWSAKTDTLVFWLPSHPGEMNTVADLHYVTARATARAWTSDRMRCAGRQP